MAVIRTPAPFVPPHAVAYSNLDGTAAIVGPNAPLPVTMSGGSPLSVSPVLPSTTPLTGTTTTTGTIGPFNPVVGRSVILALSGDWSGTAQLVRSTDGGATMLPLTIGGGVWAYFSTNCCESVWDESEAGVSLYLKVVLTSGTLTYRVAQ